VVRGIDERAAVTPNLLGIKGLAGMGRLSGGILRITGLTKSGETTLQSVSESWFLFFFGANLNTEGLKTCET
jgi:hypothetical protein